MPVKSIIVTIFTIITINAKTSFMLLGINIFAFALASERQGVMMMCLVAGYFFFLG